MKPRGINSWILIEELYGTTIRALEYRMKDDPEVVSAIHRLRTTQPPEESSTWMLLVLMMASLHPTATDILESNRPETLPRISSIRRAMRMIVGLRGVAHGWGGTMPAIAYEIQRSGSKQYVFPERWAPDVDSDGDSSYRSDSPTPDGSGPLGVVAGQQPVSGSTSFSDTSEDDVPGGRLSMFLGGGPTDPAERKLMTRFDKFLTQSNRERRKRRTVRRTRRLARLQSETTQCDEDPRTANEKRHERIQNFREELRNEIRKTWFRYYGQQPNSVQKKMKEMKLVCRMTPVNWVAQKGPK